MKYTEQGTFIQALTNLDERIIGDVGLYEEFSVKFSLGFVKYFLRKKNILLNFGRF